MHSHVGRKGRPRKNAALRLEASAKAAAERAGTSRKWQITHEKQD